MRWQLVIVHHAGPAHQRPMFHFLQLEHGAGGNKRGSQMIMAHMSVPYVCMYVTYKNS